MTSQQAHTIIGTPFFLSPEICLNEPYSFESDMWALGCVLYKLLTFTNPFHADNMTRLVLKILDGKYTAPSRIYSPELRAVVDALLQIDAKKRPATGAVLRLPFLQDAIENEIRLSQEKDQRKQQEQQVRNIKAAKFVIQGQTLALTNCKSEDSVFTRIESLRFLLEQQLGTHTLRGVYDIIADITPAQAREESTLQKIQDVLGSKMPALFPVILQLLHCESYHFSSQPPPDVSTSV